MSVCMRCQTLAPTRPCGKGFLWLCEACPVQVPPCQEYAHTFHASRITGIWVCLACGETLESQDIEPAPDAQHGSGAA